MKNIFYNLRYFTETFRRSYPPEVVHEDTIFARRECKCYANNDSNFAAFRNNGPVRASEGDSARDSTKYVYPYHTDIPEGTLPAEHSKCFHFNVSG